MVVLTDTRASHPIHTRATKTEGVGTRAAIATKTTITDKRITERAMGANRLTTLTKPSTTMIKIISMILRMMAKGMAVSTELTMTLETKVQKPIIQVKGSIPSM